MTEVAIPLTIRDLTHEDLPSCAWSGSASHLAHVATALDRAERGELDYLAVCPPSGLPVATGGIEYKTAPGAGTLFQFGVHPALRSCGIGTLLIEAAEQRVRARGLHRAELGVEENNPRARALYERLGYVAYGSKPAAWDVDAPDGSITRYETVLTLMRKELPQAGEGSGRQPVLKSNSYLPAKLVAGSPITTPDTGPGGTYARLRDLGHQPTRFREDLRARMPEPGETIELGLAAGTPVVEIIRTAYTDDGQPVEVSEMIADAGAYVFRYDFATT